MENKRKMKKKGKEGVGRGGRASESGDIGCVSLYKEQENRI